MNSVNYCTLFIFADDLKIFRIINSPHDCLLLQSNVNSVSDWCTANSMRLNIAKTRVVSYTKKTNFLCYEYQLCHATITRTSSIKDLGVFFDSKLHFHSYVGCLFSQYRPYSFRNLQIFLPGVSIYTILYFSPVQVGICLGSLEPCHVH
jgi:hypothetical protein